MAAHRLLIEAGPGETRIVLVRDGRAVEIWYDRAGAPSRVGAIHLGRLLRVERGLDAAFVDIGGDRPGFLRAADAGGAGIARRVREGEALLVQVDRDGVGGKGPRLTTRATLPGRRLVLVPGGPGITVSRRIPDAAERARLAAALAVVAGPDAGFVVRTAAADAEAAALVAEARRLSSAWDGIVAAAGTTPAPALLHAEPLDERLLRGHVDRVDLVRVEALTAGDDVVRRLRARLADWAPDAAGRLQVHSGGEPLLEAEGVEAEIERALSRRVALPGGGRVTIDRTEALVAIDVDSGASTATGDAERGARDVDLEAAGEIARQLRLRAIGGTVVIDFVSLAEPRHRRAVVAALRRALAEDPEAGRVHAVDALGLAALTRRRSRPALDELLCEAAGDGRRPTAATVAHAVLRRVARLARAAPTGGLAVTVAPEMVSVLQSAAPALGAAAARLVCRGEARFTRDRFDVTLVAP